MLACAVSDGDTGSATSSTTVTVQNIDPTANAGGPYSVSEGATVILSGSGSDVVADIPDLDYEWDLDNDGFYDDAFVANPVFDATNLDGNATSIHTVKLRVSDGDGGAATSTTTVTVTNVNPTANAGGPYSVNEGSSVTLAATGNDVPGDPLTYEWDLDNDGFYDDATGASVSFNATSLDGTTVINVGVRVTDGDTGSATSSTTVTVQNINPTANAGGPYLTFDDTPITLSGSGSDAPADIPGLIYKWDLDGDSVFGEIADGAATKTAPAPSSTPPV